MRIGCDMRWEDQFLIKRHRCVDSRLTPLFTDAFSDDWSPIFGYPMTFMVIFEWDTRGEITGVKVSGSRVRIMRFDR